MTGNRAFVTDRGIETDLIHRRGADLPDFAAFPLLDTADGRAMMRSYYDNYAPVAGASGQRWCSSAPHGGRTPTGGDRLATQRTALTASTWTRSRWWPTFAALAATHADLRRPTRPPTSGRLSASCAPPICPAQPIAVSFTVETGGRLPSGTTLADASTASHAELDDAVERGDGDPVEFGAAQRALLARMPHLSILGGCCGTDARHIAALVDCEPPDMEGPQR